MPETPESAPRPSALVPSTGAAFILTFLFTLSATPATYITSNYLHDSFGDAAVGWLYTLGATLGIFGLSLCFWAVRRFGNAATFGGIVLACLLGATAMAIDGNPWLAAAGFVVFFATNVAGNFSIDLFLEASTQNEHTGKVRGWSLTFENSAFVLGALSASFLVVGHTYWRVFAFGAFVLALTWAFARRRFSGFRDPSYRGGGVWASVREILGRWNTRKAFACFLALQLFYAWMVIYTPIYLVTKVGLPLSEVTLIIAIALVPFVLLQEWVGRLADCCTGEQEFLATGLAVMGLATLSLPLIQSQSFWIWCAALFMTRVGAAVTETMTYSYLFKKIDSRDAGVMQLIHAIRPAATIVAPILAAAILAVIDDIRALFVVLGVACLVAIVPALRLHDTK